MRDPQCEVHEYLMADGRCTCSKSAADRKEPPPVKSNRPAIQDLVAADIEARKQFGIRKYGTALQPFNGRDALMDAYQEALDLAMYLRQALEERGAGKTDQRP